LLSTNAIDSVANTYTPGVKGATGSATLIYYRLEGRETSKVLSMSSRDSAARA
jgi:hypothetical protein